MNVGSSILGRHEVVKPKGHDFAMKATVLAEQEIKTSAATLLPLRRDRELWLVLILLTAIYLTAIFFEEQRFVWFDELCTFDIARAGSLHQLWQWVRKYDNNPPTVYLLSRFSMWIFGPTPLGLRLPSIVEFYLASIAMLIYVRRKASNAVAAFAVAMLWSSATFYYATEARVYALVFLSFVCLLLSWDKATKSADRTFALWCVGISAFVLLLSHVFASLCLFAFVIAESVRYLRRRKPDYPLYLALVLPMAAMLMYIPLLRVYQGLMLWPLYHASPLMAGKFYYRAFDSIARSMFLVSLAVMLLRLFAKSKESLQTKYAYEDRALYACMLLNPLLLNLLLMHRKGDFFDRYTLTANVVLYGVLAVFYAVQLHFNRVMGYTATFIMVVLMAHTVQRDWLRRPRQLNPDTFRSIRPDLPIVVSNGATFVEMNQHETPEVVARLYYAKDRAAAIKWDGTNYYYDFEALDDMKRAGFPFAGNVEQYSKFIAEHRVFLIYADPWEWLPLKLQEDGAQFTLVRGFTNIPRPNQIGLPQSIDPVSTAPTLSAPHISYATPFVAEGSPYVISHVYLVTLPVK
jgi:hypothetical protein